MTEENLSTEQAGKKTVSVDPVEFFLFPEQQTEQEEDNIDKNRVAFDPNADEEETETTSVIEEIETIAEEQSLYEREGSMDNFEECVAMEIGTSSNVTFRHRNLERGKGIYINGFKANHYPDFILQTKSGKTILIETKGDHLDGSDSESKCRLGNEWERQAGQDFSYFMVFDKKELAGAYTLDKAKELINKM